MGSIWQCLKKVLIVTVGDGGLRACCGQRPGMPSNTYKPPHPKQELSSPDVITAEFEKPCPSPLILKVDYVQIVGNCLNQVLNYPLTFHCHFAVSSRASSYSLAHMWLAVAYQLLGPDLFAWPKTFLKPTILPHVRAWARLPGKTGSKSITTK